MITHPAFEAALAANDHRQLLSLYTTAISQRDRAEAIIRALLNPATSTQTIMTENSHASTDKDQSNTSRGHSVQHSKSSDLSNPHATNVPLAKKQSKSRAVKPNLADAI